MAESAHQRGRTGGRPIEVLNLGRVEYGPALDLQRAHHEAVLGWRGEGLPDGGPVGRVLVVEHDPVITISRRPGVAANLLATPEVLAQHGVATHETDRGGDITYHGPGQIVVYPIIDLKRTGIRVIEYIRLLEQAIIETIGGYGVSGERDPDATGVWVGGEPDSKREAAKIAAIGVRVRKWVTLHGLALNVRTDLSHFAMIVPCGLAGRPVTSLETLLGDRCPPTEEVAAQLVAVIERLIELEL